MHRRVRVGGVADVTRIGKRIREERAARNQTIKEVAAEVGISVSTLSRAERGFSTDPLTLAALNEWLMGEYGEDD